MTHDSRASGRESTAAEYPLDGAAAYVPALKNLVFRVLKHRWKAIVICIIAVLAVSVLVTLLFTRRTWEATATLLYTPLPVPLDFQDLYEPPDLSSTSPLALSRTVLEGIKKDYDLPIPVKTLRKFVRVEPSPGSDNLLEISFEWGNSKEAAEIANSVAKRFRMEVGRVRKQAMKSYYTNLQKYLASCKTRLETARKRLNEYSANQNVIDADGDIENLQDEIHSLEEAHAKAERENVELAAQSKKIKSHIENLKHKDTEEARKAKEYEAAHESITDARRRQDRLRELIGEERRIIKVKALLEAKRREYERAAKLVKKQLIPKTKFEKIQGEMESLMAQIEENKSILKWKSELQKIDETVVPEGETKQTGSPIITQVLFRKLELDLQILANEQKLFQLQKSLTAKRSLREQLVRRRHGFQTLEDDVDTIDDERRATEDRLAVLRTLSSLGPVEFNVITPAEPAKYATHSNRKYLFAGIFVLGAMLSAAMISSLEIYKNGLMTVEERLAIFGLTKLGRMSPEVRDNLNRSSPCQKAVRQLALKIRQTVVHPGAIILFSDLDDGSKSPAALLAELALCMACRDERVLIWAANDSPDSQKAFDALIESECLTISHEPVGVSSREQASGIVEQTALQTRTQGLAEYLSFTCMDLPEFIFPTTMPGVDCLLMGQSKLPPEGFATHRMQEMLAELRNKYSIIIVDGPSVSQDDDLELLVPYSDGIVFLTHDAQSTSSKADEVLRGLYQLHAPIIGGMIF